eukprot:4969085-Pyramimonas_sp.AAC.1
MRRRRRMWRRKRSTKLYRGLLPGSYACIGPPAALPPTGRNLRELRATYFSSPVVICACMTQ